MRAAFPAGPQAYRPPAAPPPRSAPAGTFLPGTKVQVGNHRVVIDKYLSEGGFAHVYVVRLSKPINGEDTAVLKRVAVPDKDSLASMRTEVETMKKLKGHSHIVRYIDSHASSLKDGGYEVFLLMEYCNGGGLIDFMNTRLQNRLTEPEILKIFSDSCQGLASMHYLKPPLLHRDLKVENILISGTGSNKQFKLCDFGSTAPPRPAAKTADEGRLIEEDIQENTTMQYRSPEMIDVYRKQPIDEKSDIWALGVFLYKLCYYTTPFEEQGQMAILNAKFKFPALPQFSDRLKHLIAMMLKEHPSGRPNIYQVFKEVCAMRNRDCPLQDIYSGRTASEARRNQELPVPPRDDTPVGITKIAPPPERKLVVPEVKPMRRGRPTSSSAAVSQNPSPSPGRPASHDPFAALDGGQGVSAQTAAIDELSSKFPSLDQFSLLHDSGGQFAFESGNKAPPRTEAAPTVSSPPQNATKHVSQSAQQAQQQLSQRVSEALADEAFARPKTVAPPVSQKPRIMQNVTARTDMATQTSFSEKSPPPQPARPTMISTGTMTASPTKSFTPELPSRPIFRIPPSDHRSALQTGKEEQQRSESTPRQSLSVARPPLLEHRSKSQTSVDDLAHARQSSTVEHEDHPHRAHSTNHRHRPISATFQTASRLLHVRSSSTSKSRPDRTSGVLIDTTDTVEPENVQADSNVEFLRQMEGEDTARRQSKRLSNGAGLAHHFKRNSGNWSGHKSILSGRKGDTFQKFESQTLPYTENDREPASAANVLSPITSADTNNAVAIDDNVLEETQDLPPEMRREMERRRLSQEERRVAEAAAAYKQRVASNGAHRGGGGGDRASAIQNRVQALLDDSAQKSPTKTASGYGKYTNEPSPREEEKNARVPQQQLAQQGFAGPHVTASAPAGMAAPDRVFARPSAPPKPHGLRTGGGPGPGGIASSEAPMSTPTTARPSQSPAVARKPANLTGTSTGQSLLQRRLAEDQANSQAGHSGLQDDGRPISVSATGPAAARGGGQVPTTTNSRAATTPTAPANDEDWETSFSKRYPSLGNLEMEEMKI